ncbi:endonuclease/exonuclease/phosphatase family metal-dependent hydrolase [Georgenia soli]|uniref:Endonuclease/exonuclease/phosphatase family metal-dependent hydrolase n=1 Tax=Georgenia soli TaxID=638953 RepID=A0A2A9EPQ4_9MICO|nr:endonuclease/exonuclease/phosphatase family protein [Georgenia soli]PFG40245.1 endonuclease/exonuclease/phosphatase family metal-dependent hydrolase [Georgenia soli]
MRVLTLNLQHAAPARTAVDAGGPAGATTLDRAAEEIAATGADVVLLQEVDRNLRRSGGLDQAATLAQRLGMAHRFAANIAGTRVGVPLPARVSTPARGYGVALLTRLPVATWHVMRLRGGGPRRRTGRPAWSPLGWTWDPTRVLLAAVLRTGAGPVSVGVTHLSVRPDVARRQLTAAAGALLTLPGPHLLGGDLNLDAAAVASSEVVADGRLAPLAAGLTFTNARPRTQLDHLLASGLVATGPAVVHHLSVSDHAGLSVDVHRS